MGAGRGRDRAHSTLEVVSNQHMNQPSQQKNPLSTDLGKQVVSHEGKQVFLNDDGPEPVAEKASYAHNDGDPDDQGHRSGGPSRKKWVLFGGVVGLIIVLAVVLGSVFGSRHKRSATNSFINPSNSSAHSSPAPTSSPPTPLLQHNLAALSFASNSVNNTRVYFQDNVGQIVEAANSADNTTWTIDGTGIIGKNGSAIAAAVSRTGFPLVSHAFYMLIRSHRYVFRPSVCSI